jgi:signal peptide peptidase SppA
MSNLLVHIADRVLNRPLMVTPEKLAMIAQVLDGRIGIDASEFAAIEAEQLRNGPDASRFVGQFDLANQNDPKSTKPYRTTDKGVALINVFGSLVNRGAWIGARSGMTSYEGLKYQIAAAAADRDVTSILLDIDSPGGEAVGAFEVADAVRAASKSKDIVAVVNGMAASAAYAIASGAPTIITTASGISGSIGVVLMHADYSHALHERGITPTLIHAGARKVDGSPYKPLTDDVKAELKAEVDSFYDLFVGSVAVGRKGKMTDASIRATEARTYIGADAVKVGLADAVGSFETVLADLSGRGTVRNSNRSYRMNDKSFSQADLDAAVTAAVATARTEATTVLNAAKAEHETSLQAAVAGAKAEGAKAERERIKGIISSEEAKGREKGALHLALTASLSADEAKAVLTGMAKEAAPGAGAGSHGLFLTEDPPHGGGDKKADHGWGDVISDINKKNRPR